MALLSAAAMLGSSLLSGLVGGSGPGDTAPTVSNAIGRSNIKPSENDSIQDNMIFDIAGLSVPAQLVTPEVIYNMSLEQDLQQKIMTAEYPSGTGTQSITSLPPNNSVSFGLAVGDGMFMAFNSLGFVLDGFCVRPEKEVQNQPGATPVEQFNYLVDPIYFKPDYSSLTGGMNIMENLFASWDVKVNSVSMQTYYQSYVGAAMYASALGDAVMRTTNNTHILQMDEGSISQFTNHHTGWREIDPKKNYKWADMKKYGESGIGTTTNPRVIGNFHLPQGLFRSSQGLWQKQIIQFITQFSTHPAIKYSSSSKVTTNFQYATLYALSAQTKMDFDIIISSMTLMARRYKYRPDIVDIFTVPVESQLHPYRFLYRSMPEVPFTWKEKFYFKDSFADDYAKNGTGTAMGNYAEGKWNGNNAIPGGAVTYNDIYTLTKGGGYLDPEVTQRKLQWRGNQTLPEWWFIYARCPLLNLSQGSNRDRLNDPIYCENVPCFNVQSFDIGGIVYKTNTTFNLIKTAGWLDLKQKQTNNEIETTMKPDLSMKELMLTQSGAANSKMNDLIFVTNAANRVQSFCDYSSSAATSAKTFNEAQSEFPVILTVGQGDTTEEQFAPRAGVNTVNIMYGRVAADLGEGGIANCPSNKERQEPDLDTWYGSRIVAMQNYETKPYVEMEFFAVPVMSTLSLCGTKSGTHSINLTTSFSAQAGGGVQPSIYG